MFRALFVADNPRTEDPLGLKCGSRTLSPCYLCTAKRDTFFPQQMQNYERFSVQNVLWRKLETKLQNPKWNQLQTNYQYCQLQLSFTHFAMIGVHSSVDIHDVFRVDPMHVLSHGVSRLLKECLINMLSSDKETTTAMRLSNGQTYLSN